MISDVRYALRMLGKHRSFTIISVLTLALGIGANTAIFSVLNTYLFRALPYSEPGRLVRVFRTSIHSRSWPHSVANFVGQHDRNTVFEKLAAYNGIGPNLVDEGHSTERLQGIQTTADLFPVLGTQPLIGRVFTAEDDQPGAGNVAVLSHRFWMRRFGGDPNVINRNLRLDGEDIRVIGVMPPKFEHPMLWGSIDLWRPMAFTAQQRQDRGNNYLKIVGRLKPSVTQTQAEQSMVALMADIGRENASNQGESVRLEQLSVSMSDPIARNIMWFTFALAGFVLLIACANLANLQLVRTAARAREYAVRAALGAGRGRLIRQSMIESLTISLIGGLISLALAWMAVKYISSRMFTNLPGAEVSLDGRVFGFALLASVVTGLVFGLLPAWFASRADVNQSLRENSRGATAGRTQQRLRGALIVGEVAFALVLLTGAGLFLRGLQRFSNADPGWQVDGLLTARMGLRGPNYPNPAARLTFFQNLEARLKQMPGVTSVALSGSQPVYGFDSSGNFIIEGQPLPDDGQYPESFFESVTDDYFTTIGARLVAGRSFLPEDASQARVIINQTMARKFWPNESAVGKRVGRRGQNAQWSEIIGVVEDIRFPANLGEPYTRYQTFRPFARSTPQGISIIVRSAAPPESFISDLRRVTAELDSTQPVSRMLTARALVNEGLGDVSLLGSLLGTFASIGLLLAAVGIYGVTSYSVLQRTGEFGVRMALGAQRSNVLWLVVRKGALLVGSGAVIGVAGSVAIARLLASAIPALPTRDPLAMTIVAAILIAVGLFACLLPARRATKVDPLVALRHQ